MTIFATFQIYDAQMFLQGMINNVRFTSSVGDINTSTVVFVTFVLPHSFIDHRNTPRSFDRHNTIANEPKILSRVIIDIMEVE